MAILFYTALFFFGLLINGYVQFPCVLAVGLSLLHSQQQELPLPRPIRRLAGINAVLFLFSLILISGKGIASSPYGLFYSTDSVGQLLVVPLIISLGFIALFGRYMDGERAPSTAFTLSPLLSAFAYLFHQALHWPILGLDPAKIQHASYFLLATGFLAVAGLAIPWPAWQKAALAYFTALAVALAAAVAGLAV